MAHPSGQTWQAGRWGVGVVIFVGVAGGVYWGARTFWGAPSPSATAPTEGRFVAATKDEASSPPSSEPATPENAPAPPPPADPREIAELMEGARQCLERQDLVQARTLLNEAWKLTGGRGEQADALRPQLISLAEETLFSNRVFSDDPLVERYVVQSGDTLAKIAQAYLVTDDLLARINNLADKNMIRLGQTLKVIHGPFHVHAYKGLKRLDVYLQDLPVRSYPIGVGADDGTPAGIWSVKTKLRNPTYYPPRGGKIIAADDPKNPLGERWIGLEGVSGEALGQQRYGIHGTNDPDSIGQAVSLGCIRLHNADVEALFDLLTPGHSLAAVAP